MKTETSFACFCFVHTLQDIKRFLPNVSRNDGEQIHSPALVQACEIYQKLSCLSWTNQIGVLKGKSYVLR